MLFIPPFHLVFFVHSIPFHSHPLDRVVWSGSFHPFTIETILRYPPFPADKVKCFQSGGWFWNGFGYVNDAHQFRNHCASSLKQSQLWLEGNWARIPNNEPVLIHRTHICCRIQTAMAQASQGCIYSTGVGVLLINTLHRAESIECGVAVPVWYRRCSKVPPSICMHRRMNYPEQTVGERNTLLFDGFGSIRAKVGGHEHG